MKNLQLPASTGFNPRDLYNDDERGILEALDTVGFDPTKKPPKETSILSINGISLARTGGLSSVQGHEGTAKSSFLEGAIAAVISEKRGDFLGWRRDKKLPGKVLHFDCEQSRADHWSFCERVRSRAGITGASPLFRSHCLTGWGVAEAREAIELAAAEYSEAPVADGGLDDFGIDLILIDGFADLVHSVNDEVESKDLVSQLIRLAMTENREAHVMGVLHLNPQSNAAQSSKGRGHLGSQINRKAETVIQLDRKSDGSVIAYTTKSRKAPIAKADAIRIGFNEGSARWESLAAAAVVKTESDAQAMVPALKAAYGNDVKASFRHGELAQIFADALKRKLATGKQKIGYSVSAGLIRKITDSDTKERYVLDTLGITLISASKPDE